MLVETNSNAATASVVNSLGRQTAEIEATMNSF